jgi:hypothetical protein
MRTTLWLLAPQSTDDGLTFHEILSGIPTDPASIVTLVLLLGAGVIVLWTGRPRGKGGRPA